LIERAAGAGRAVISLTWVSRTGLPTYDRSIYSSLWNILPWLHL